MRTGFLTFVLWASLALPANAQNQWAKEYYQRGELELYLGDNKQAIEQYNLALKQAPTFAEAYFSRGRAYLRLHERQKAAQDFYETLRLQPHRAEAYFYLGAVFHENNEPARALEYYNRALEIDDKLAIAYNYRAELHRKQGLISLALEDYNRAIRFGGNQALLFFGRGKCLLALQKIEDAVEDFNQAIALEPRQKLYYQYRLEANFVSMNYAKTAEDIEHLRQMRGDSLDDTYKSLLAFCYLELKDCARAVGAIERLPKEEREQPKWLISRANCYYTIKSLDKALNDYQRLHQLMPDSIAYHRRYVELLWAGKAHELFLKESQPYLERQTQDAEVWYWVGFAHSLLGRKKECKQALQTAQLLGYRREDMDASLQPYVKKRKAKK